MIEPIVLFNGWGGWGGGWGEVKFWWRQKKLGGVAVLGWGRDFSRLGENIKFLKGIVQESTQVNLPNLLNS